MTDNQIHAVTIAANLISVTSLTTDRDVLNELISGASDALALAKNLGAEGVEAATVLVDALDAFNDEDFESSCSEAHDALRVLLPE